MQGRLHLRSFAQCQQNANSYVKAAKYMAACDAVPHNIPLLKGGKVTKRCHTKHYCAAAGARHQVLHFIVSYYYYYLLNY
jgi:hypothetical protein